MIIGALIDEFAKRFQHEKRAQVCLWFDEKGEFEGLLGKLQQQLALIQPPTISLLRYDPACFHGQIWMKDRVRRCPTSTRFLVYLPLSEDRLNSPDANGENYLELLEEYRIAGVIWRLNGKQPTLFGFLRQIGLDLPDSPAEQRRLYEGGRNSLLAKYVAGFVDRPASFWKGTLTAEIAQSRLIGDLEKTILDVAADPEAKWKELESSGLLPEFLDMVRERYGFESPSTAPSKWIEQFVELLALTETFLGYGEPADFPFQDRLPPVALRDHYVQFLRRWLKDADSRPVWERCISHVESHLNLSDWVAAKEGLSFGLPHLVALRWQQTLAEFEKAATKSSTTDSFFASHRGTIQREEEYGKASPNPVGAWALLSALDRLLSNCRDAVQKIDRADSVQQLARLYVHEAPHIEGEHIRIASGALNYGLPTLSRVGKRAYAGYANQLNDKFFSLYTRQDSVGIPGFESVTDHLQKELWSRSGRRAVLIVDAFRLDAAYFVKDGLKGHAIEIHPVLAILPTVTPVGMTALLPLNGTNVTFEFENNQLHPRVNGKDTSVRSNRLAILREFGADCREIEELENTATRPDDLGQLLVVFGHEAVDSFGHDSADILIRHIDREVERLAMLIRKLHRWGYPEVHVVTDHGFILIDEEKLPPVVSCDKSWCHVRKERFALVPATADLPVVTVPFAWDSTVRVALPPGLAFFAAEKSFSHGGATLQELIIPHVVSRAQVKEKRIGIEVFVPTPELTRSSVKVIIRPKSGDEKRAGQMGLFTEVGRNLLVDVLRRLPNGERKSVLATSRPKEVQIDPGGEFTVTLFFHTAESFRPGETLDLDVRDADTLEQFPAGGTKLTVARDM